MMNGDDDDEEAGLNPSKIRGKIIRMNVMMTEIMALKRIMMKRPRYTLLKVRS